MATLRPFANEYRMDEGAITSRFLPLKDQGSKRSQNRHVCAPHSQGCRLCKYGRHGKPKDHWFRLSQDLQELQWDSSNVRAEMFLRRRCSVAVAPSAACVRAAGDECCCECMCTCMNVSCRMHEKSRAACNFRTHRTLALARATCCDCPCSHALTPGLNITTLSSSSQGKQRSARLSDVLRIQPGQTTPVFRRHPAPELAGLSFSIIYCTGPGHRGRERSLDLICSTALEYDVWFWGLRLFADWARGFLVPLEKRKAADGVAVATHGADAHGARARAVRGATHGCRKTVLLHAGALRDGTVAGRRKGCSTFEETEQCGGRDGNCCCPCCDDNVCSCCCCWHPLPRSLIWHYCCHCCLCGCKRTPAYVLSWPLMHTLIAAAPHLFHPCLNLCTPFTTHRHNYTCSVPSPVWSLPSYWAGIGLTAALLSQGPASPSPSVLPLCMGTHSKGSLLKGASFAKGATGLVGAASDPLPQSVVPGR